jgi:alpha-amylase
MHTTHGIAGDEVNQTTQHMRYGLEAWGQWLTSVVGFQGYRFDVAHSIEPWYLSEWLSQATTSNEFAVLEHNNGASPREIQTFIQLVDQRASAFDFPLHDSYLVPMCGTGSFNMFTLYHAGLAGIMPSNAVYCSP